MRMCRVRSKRQTKFEEPESLREHRWCQRKWNNKVFDLGTHFYTQTRMETTDQIRTKHSHGTKLGLKPENENRGQFTQAVLWDLFGSERTFGTRENEPRVEWSVGHGWDGWKLQVGILLWSYALWRSVCCRTLSDNKHACFMLISHLSFLTYPNLLFKHSHRPHLLLKSSDYTLFSLYLSTLALPCLCGPTTC